MDIFTSSETNFTKGVHALIVSLCTNNFGHHNIYIAYSNIKQDRIDWIKKLERKYDISIFFVYLEKKKYFNNTVFKLSGRYVWESMIRLLPQLIVPGDCHKALYIDADIVINGSLKEFYDIDLTNKSIAVIASKRDGTGNKYYDMNAGAYDLIKIDVDDYFNAGVFLANIDYFRNNITEKTYIDVAEQYKEDLVFADQCLMNIVFEKTSIKMIDFRYNCCFACYTPIPYREYCWLKKNIVCMHFIAGPKPWNNMRYYNKLIHIYLKYVYKYAFIKGLFQCLVYSICKPFNLIKKYIRIVAYKVTK